MSVENSAITNSYSTTNNYYSNDLNSHDADNRVIVGSVNNLPEGTTEQDVANAMSNGFVMEFVNILMDKIESDPDMDPEMKEFLLDHMQTLLANNLTEVDPEVQAQVDIQLGDVNADRAHDIMDLLMAQFMDMSEEHRIEEGTNTDSDGTSSEGAAGNWLVQLAKALANIQSKWLDNLMGAYDRMQANTSPELGDDASEEDKELHAEEQKRFIQAQAEVTAYARLFGMASEVTSNVLKSVGDGLTSVARKQ